MRRLPVLIGGVVIAMVVTLASTAPATSSNARAQTAAATSAASSAQSAAVAPAPQVRKKRRNWRVWTPRPSKIISDPTVGHRQRVVMHHIVKAIRHTRRGQKIRIAVWNFDDKRAATALVRAFRRGVTIQVIAATGTNNKNWRRIKRIIKNPRMKPRNPRKSFVHRCVGSCRQMRKAGIMHAKFFLFSKVGHKARNVVMFGSTNITNASGLNQWNDLITLRNPVVFRQYRKMFNKFRFDRFDPPMYRVFRTRRRDIRSSFYPANKLKISPITRNLRAVRCHNAARGFGNRNRKTKIRIAIAGWFDQYGTRIARQLRRKSNQGCDVKVVTTLLGQGINRALNRPGPGRVPNRQITIDRNNDGIPEKYLHLKYMTIDGVYQGDRSSRVLFTGSGNWTARASRSDELLVMLKRPRWARYYSNYVDRLFRSRWAHNREVTPASLEAALRAQPNARGADATEGLPDWDW